MRKEVINMDIGISKYTIELDPTELNNLTFLLDSVVSETRPSGQLRAIAHDLLEAIRDIKNM